MTPHSAENSTGGFTLLEVMIALAILAIVCAIVYGSFFAVTSSTMDAREASEATKMRQFLLRNFRANLDQVAQGWLPGAADRIEPGEDDDVSAITFGFVGEDNRGSAGPADSLEFVTMAPMAGAVTLPGTVKRVTYDVVDDDQGCSTCVLGPYDPENPPAAFLRAVEVPVFASAAGEKGNRATNRSRGGDQHSVTWLLPIRSMDILYFDGDRWEDDWDGDKEGRLPWALDIRINLALTEGRDDEDQFIFDNDRNEGPGGNFDVQFLAALPAGTGVNGAPPTYGMESLPGRRDPAPKGNK